MLITEYNTQVQSFVRGFEQLQTGLLSSDIINPFNLKQTLNSVRTKLDRGYELATHDLSFYYNNHLAYFQYTERNLYLHLKIPLVQSNHIYNVYHVGAFPVPIDQTDGTGYSLISLHYNYILVGVSNVYYLMLTEDDLRHCDRNVLIHCETSFMKYRLTYYTCEWALWLNNKAEIMNWCDFITHPHKRIPNVLVAMENSRFIVSSPDHPISVICEDGRTKDHRQCALCSVVLPCRCQASVRGRLFRGLSTACSSTMQTPLNVINVPVLHAFNISIDLEDSVVTTGKFKIITKKVIAHLAQKGETVGQIGMSLSHLADTIKNYQRKSTQTTHWMDNQAFSYPLVILGVLSIVLSVPGIIALYRTRKVILMLSTIPAAAAKPLGDLLKLQPFPTRAVGTNPNVPANENYWPSISLIEILLFCILAVLVIMSFGRIIRCLKMICHYIGTKSNMPCADFSESWDQDTKWMNQVELYIRMGTPGNMYVFPLMTIFNLQKDIQHLRVPRVFGVSVRNAGFYSLITIDSDTNVKIMLQNEEKELGIHKELRVSRLFGHKLQRCLEGQNEKSYGQEIVIKKNKSVKWVSSIEYEGQTESEELMETNVREEKSKLYPHLREIVEN